MAEYEIDLSGANFEQALMTLGVTGGLNYAPYGATAPKNMAPYAAPFVDLGWLGDSGIGESLNQESDSWTPWQAVGPQRTQVSSEEVQFTVTLWSIGGLANALYYGVAQDDMEYDEASGVTSFETGAKLPEDFRFNLGVDIIDGKRARRFLLPSASIAERGDITYTKTDLVGYELTFKSNFDAQAGYAIRREFREGWKPGTAGTTIIGGSAKSLGDWSTEVEVTDPGAGNGGGGNP